jgi:hypothetical protein
VKTALKGKNFQHVEDSKIYVTAELNAVHFETFAVSKNVLNVSTNVLNYAKITLNTNKTIFNFLIFFTHFSHQFWIFISKLCIYNIQHIWVYIYKKISSQPLEKETAAQAKDMTKTELVSHFV